MLFNNTFLCIWGDIFGLMEKFFKISIFNFLTGQKRDMTELKLVWPVNTTGHCSKIILSPVPKRSKGESSKHYKLAPADMNKVCVLHVKRVIEPQRPLNTNNELAPLWLSIFMTNLLNCKFLTVVTRWLIYVANLSDIKQTSREVREAADVVPWTLRLLLQASRHFIHVRIWEVKKYLCIAWLEEKKDVYSGNLNTKKCLQL